MLKVYLSINNNAETLLLPVPLQELEVKETWDNKEIDGLYQTLNVITKKGLTTTEIYSFFPVRDYPFLVNRTMWGADYVDIIKRWWSMKIPIRLIVINTDSKKKMDTVNMAVTIDAFTHKTKQSGDIEFSLSFKEFVFIKI